MTTNTIPLPLIEIGMTREQVAESIKKYLKGPTLTANYANKDKPEGFERRVVDQLLDILRDGERHTNAELAEACECTSHYVGRRINELRKQGYVIHRQKFYAKGVSSQFHLVKEPK